MSCADDCYHLLKKKNFNCIAIVNWLCLDNSKATLLSGIMRNFFFIHLWIIHINCNKQIIISFAHNFLKVVFVCVFTSIKITLYRPPCKDDLTGRILLSAKWHIYMDKKTICWLCSIYTSSSIEKKNNIILVYWFRQTYLSIVKMYSR